MTTVVPPRICAAFEAGYTCLPALCFSRVLPTAVSEPQLIAVNRALAEELQWDLAPHTDATLAALFAGNVIPMGADPMALAYAGHQFGHFVPQLGDGRAILMGVSLDRAGIHRDVQWKGTGPTPYSRNGDGRAALGPVLREYLVSEAMHALHIPTTRALAAVTTGESVRRDGLLPGAILTRVASSHVRVGSFQYLAAQRDTQALRALADYVIERHYPATRTAPQPYLALLQAVADRQAELVARWMHVGFIHGVMNTDNMAVSGETLDFGPCAFMDSYDPDKVFSSIDTRGRYAYSNQPHAAQWNLTRLAECLLGLIDAVPERAVEHATVVIEQFSERFADYWLQGMRLKLGLMTALEGDLEFAQQVLTTLHRNHADYTVSFRQLAACALSTTNDAALRAGFTNPTECDHLLVTWRSRLRLESQSPDERARVMRSVNPAYIPRNHQIEAVIRAAVDRQDFEPFQTLSKALAEPCVERAEYAVYAVPPTPTERVTHTFCGT